MLTTRTFQCMTTGIELFLDAEDAGAAEKVLAEAERFFLQMEARFSRFRADSELSQLNAASGKTSEVSPDLAELVGLALRAAQMSDGIFDPTIIDKLEAAGYDQSIELVRARETIRAAGAGLGPHGQSGQGHALSGAQPISDRDGAFGWNSPRWAAVLLDPQRRTASLPDGVRLDLGGVGKGWAVDRAAELLRPLGAGLVNAGGDLRAWGDEPGAGPAQGWLVAVDDPARPGSDVVWLRVQERAAATSSITGRRWSGGHHLIDPRTGRPAATDLLSVTVLAPTTTEAEVAAKVALILGRERGLAWLAHRPGVEALIVGADGNYYGTRGISGVWL
jgi:thiamine biosynthesis lipoprotein